MKRILITLLLATFLSGIFVTAEGRDSLRENRASTTIVSNTLGSAFQRDNNNGRRRWGRRRWARRRWARRHWGRREGRAMSRRGRRE